MKTGTRDHIARRELRWVVRQPERNVMNRARSSRTAREVADAANVDEGSRAAAAGGEAPRRFLLTHRAEAKRVCEHLLAAGRVIEPERHGVETMDRILARDARCVGPCRPLLRRRMTDDLEEQAVGIGERDDLLEVGSRGPAARRPLVIDAVPNEPLDPEADRARQHRE